LVDTKVPNVITPNAQVLATAVKAEVKLVSPVATIAAPIVQPIQAAIQTKSSDPTKLEITINLAQDNKHKHHHDHTKKSAEKKHADDLDTHAKDIVKDLKKDAKKGKSSEKTLESKNSKHEIKAQEKSTNDKPIEKQKDKHSKKSNGDEDDKD